jgi:hypothetical protein
MRVTPLEGQAEQESCEVKMEVFEQAHDDLALTQIMSVMLQVQAMSEAFPVE